MHFILTFQGFWGFFSGWQQMSNISAAQGNHWAVKTWAHCRIWSWQPTSFLGQSRPRLTSSINDCSPYGMRRKSSQTGREKHSVLHFKDFAIWPQICSFLYWLWKALTHLSGSFNMTMFTRHAHLTALHNSFPVQSSSHTVKAEALQKH